MKRLVTLFMLMALTAVSTTALAAPPADTLAEVKKKKVLVAGVKDSLPPSATSMRRPAPSSATTSTSSTPSPPNWASRSS